VLKFVLKCQVNHVALIPIPRFDSKPLKMYWNVRIIGHMVLAFHEQVLNMFALIFYPLCSSVSLALYPLILPYATNHFISCLIFFISIHTSYSSPSHFLHFKFQFHAKLECKYLGAFVFYFYAILISWQRGHRMYLGYDVKDNGL
jgi:hypothetical protein